MLYIVFWGMWIWDKREGGALLQSVEADSSAQGVLRQFNHARCLIALLSPKLRWAFVPESKTDYDAGMTANSIDALPQKTRVWGTNIWWCVPSSQDVGCAARHLPWPTMVPAAVPAVWEWPEQTRDILIPYASLLDYILRCGKEARFYHVVIAVLFWSSFGRNVCQLIGGEVRN